MTSQSAWQAKARKRPDMMKGNAILMQTWREAAGITVTDEVPPIRNHNAYILYPTGSPNGLSRAARDKC
jgi:hypothetical protein